MNYPRLFVVLLGLTLATATVEAKSSSSKSSSKPHKAKVHVKGYTKKDGTYVAPHDRTAPNSSKMDNWSAKGNVNPETGKGGTVDPNSPTPPKK